MQYLSKLLLVPATLLACHLVVAQEPAARDAAVKRVASPDGWKLVWADEFDQNGSPDPQKWTWELGFVRNHELQWYQPENARCENGRLIIEARREQKRNTDFDPASNDWRRNREFADYTSACLTTRDLHSWQYGRFEMKARIDTRPGLWPAFWTLGVRGGWPRCGEIDIMEFYRGSLLANVGWHVRDKADNAPGRQQGVVWWDDLRKPIESFNDPEWHTKFHVWRMDWDADHIKIYVDDELLKHVEIKHSVSRSGTSPFRQPHYLLLNLAIGGHGGDPAKTQFPARMEVDYVRIYQKQPEGPGAPEAPARSGQAPAAEPEGGSNAVLAAYADDRERDGPIP